MNYLKILNKIDNEMQFVKWYNIKTVEQKETLKDLMQAGFLPDCIFNKDYTKFKKSKEDYEEYLIKPIEKIKS